MDQIQPECWWSIRFHERLFFWSRGAQSLHSHVVVVQLRETHSISLSPKQRELTQGSMPMCLTIFIPNVVQHVVLLRITEEKLSKGLREKNILPAIKIISLITDGLQSIRYLWSYFILNIFRTQGPRIICGQLRDTAFLLRKPPLGFLLTPWIREWQTIDAKFP